MSTAGSLFSTHGVVPDVLEAVDFSAEIEVVFGGGLKVAPACDLTPAKTRSTPAVRVLSGAKPDVAYTLLMVDPDAPSRASPKYREWLHWIVVNCPGADVSKGLTVSDYMGPAPPKGTGKHRYVFVLCEQPGRVPSDKFEDRPSFSAKAWIAKNKLRVVGATFFFAQN